MGGRKSSFQLVMLKKVFVFALLLFMLSSTVHGQDFLLAEGSLQVPYDSGMHNADLACQYINGTVVAPGQEFSFNQIVGERTPERGFVDGEIITYRNGGYIMTQGLGGGICRTATALHQTVVKAGLEVIERHDHAAPVCYAEKGTDAAIYQNVKNYRFMNNRENSIKINMTTENDVIYVAIYEILSEKNPIIITEIPLPLEEGIHKVADLVKNETAYAALRDLAELLKADVEWYEETKTASMVYGHHRLLFKDDLLIALINEKPVELKQPAKIINDRMMLPLATIAQIFEELEVFEVKEKEETKETKETTETTEETSLIIAEETTNNISI